MKALLLLFTSIYLTACSDLFEDDEDSEEKSYSGYFLDSGVEQLAYRSNSFTDSTLSTGGNGQFSYIPGEVTTFTFLGLNLGSVSPSPSKPVITPATLLNVEKSRDDMATFLADRANNSSAQTLTNMLVLLQSFDEDQNPENGIKLPTKFDDAELTDSQGSPLEYDNLLSDLNITRDATTFSSTALAKLNTIQGRDQSTLVSEADAIAHFLSTLEKLETATEYSGRWGMRSGSHGDLSAIYSFNADGSVLLEEYDNCPGNLWGSNEALLASNCTRVEINQTIVANGAGFELVNNDFTDTCLPLSINSHEALLACDFYGSGLGNETIRLQRAPTDFTEAPLTGTYTTIEAGSTSITNTTFTEEDNATNTGTDAGTDFNWAFTSDTVLALSDGITENFTFNGYIKGSWLVGTSDAAINTIFRSTDNITNANLLNFSGFFGVFDVDGNGQCEKVVIKDPNYSTSNANEFQFIEFDNAAGVSYSCDYPSDWYEQSLETDRKYTVSFNSSYMTIQGTPDRHCFLLGIDDYQIDTFYVACNNPGNTALNVEIWRGL